MMVPTRSGVVALALFLAVGALGNEAVVTDTQQASDGVEVITILEHRPPDDILIQDGGDGDSDGDSDRQAGGGAVQLSEQQFDADDDYGTDGESTSDASYIVAVISVAVAVVTVAIAVVLRRNRTSTSPVEQMKPTQTSNRVRATVPKPRLEGGDDGTSTPASRPKATGTDTLVYETPVLLNAQKGNWLNSQGKAYGNTPRSAAMSVNPLSPINRFDSTSTVATALPDTVRRVKFGNRRGAPVGVSTPNMPGQIPSANKRTARKQGAKGTPTSDYIRPHINGPAPPTQPRRGTASRLISLYEKLPSLSSLTSSSKLKEADNANDIEVWTIDTSPEAHAFETPYRRDPIKYDIGIEQTPKAPKPQVAEETVEEPSVYDLGTAPPLKEEEAPEEEGEEITASPSSMAAVDGTGAQDYRNIPEDQSPDNSL